MCKNILKNGLKTGGLSSERLLITNAVIKKKKRKKKVICTYPSTDGKLSVVHKPNTESDRTDITFVPASFQRVQIPQVSNIH